MNLGPDAPKLLRLNDEVKAFVDDGVIMLKAVSPHGDPVEFTELDALRLASWLQQWALHLDDDLEA